MPDVFSRLSRPPSIDPNLLRGIETRREEFGNRKASDKLREVIDDHNTTIAPLQDDSVAASADRNGIGVVRRQSGEVFSRLYNAVKDQKVRRRVHEEMALHAQQHEEADHRPMRSSPRDGFATSTRLFDDAKSRREYSQRKQAELDDDARKQADTARLALTQRRPRLESRERSESASAKRGYETRGKVHERLYRTHDAHRKRLEELSNKHIASTCPFRPNTGQGKMQKSNSASTLHSRSSSAPRGVPNITFVAPPKDTRDVSPDSLPAGTPTTQQVIETLGSARRAANELLDSLGAHDVTPREELVRTEPVGFVGGGVFEPPPRAGLRY